MDDLFLYNHIKQAIKQRKQLAKDPQQGNFAQTYCRRQLMKKKLNYNSSSSNSKNKMKSLMKNFAHLQTYVDLNQLLYSINLIRTKQLAQRKLNSMKQKHRMSRISRLNDLQKLNQLPLSRFNQQKSQQIIIDPIQALRDKFRGSINQMIKRKCHAENNQIDQIVQYLQKQTYINNQLLKNNSTNYLSYLNQQLQKIQNDEDANNQNTQQNWKIFRQLTQTLSQPLYDKDKKKQYFKSTNLNSKQKKQQNQLLHKITTFLQIALQNQHKQKWATKQMKKFRSTHGSFRFKKDKDQRSKFFLKGIQIQKQNKQIFSNITQSLNSRSMSRKNTIRKNNQNFIKKIKSEQRNIFGKRSIDRQKVNIKEITNLNKTNSSWNAKGKISKENISNLNLFKSFQNNNQRKTQPVNKDKIFQQLKKDHIFQQFNHNMSKDFLSPDDKISQKNILQDNQKQNQSIFKVKKQYQLNKRKKHRQYNFITPGRNKFHYKTVIIQPNNSLTNKLDQTQSQINNQTCLQGFLGSPLKSRRDKVIHTQLIPQQQKSSSLLSDSCLKAQKGKTFYKHQNVNKANQSLNSTGVQSFNATGLSKSNSLAQTFTFKKRNKKQLILNKLESFIQEINNQQKISKMENEYYDSAINHLHDLSKSTYKNYQPQALAGYQQISELKKFVNAINPSLRKNHSKNSAGKMI